MQRSCIVDVPSMEGLGLDGREPTLLFSDTAEELSIAANGDDVEVRLHKLDVLDFISSFSASNNGN